MEALQDTLPQIQGHEGLIALRQRASLLVSQSESEELLAYLNELRLPYIQGCVLVGLSVYGKGRT